MSKTDKELATEITEVFIQSWNARTTAKALTASQVCDVLTAVHNTLYELDYPKPESKE